MNLNVRVGAIIIKENKILLTRINRKNKLTYVLPGGGLELTEDIFSAIKREVYEETYLKVDDLKMKFIKELYTNEGEHGIEFIFVPKIVEGEKGLGYDPEYENEPVLDEVEFYNIEDLDEINFHPKQLVKELKNGIEKLNDDEITHLGLFEFPEK